LLGILLAFPNKHGFGGGSGGGFGIGFEIGFDFGS
jgi:hypothetical protein